MWQLMPYLETMPNFSVLVVLRQTHRKQQYHPKSWTQCYSRTQIRLDGEGLDRAVAFYLGQALADSTKKSYKSDKRRYHSFCTVHNINPLPVCEQSLSRYAASLANEGLAHTSIKCYMSAVRHLHIEEGWGDPKLKCMPKLELVMRGIKRTGKET